MWQKRLYQGRHLERLYRHVEIDHGRGAGREVHSLEAIEPADQWGRRLQHGDIRFAEKREYSRSIGAIRVIRNDGTLYLGREVRGLDEHKDHLIAGARARVRNLHRVQFHRTPVACRERLRCRLRVETARRRDVESCQRHAGKGREGRFACNKQALTQNYVHACAKST